MLTSVIISDHTIVPLAAGISTCCRSGAGDLRWCHHKKKKINSRPAGASRVRLRADISTHSKKPAYSTQVCASWESEVKKIRMSLNNSVKDEL